MSVEPYQVGSGLNRCFFTLWTCGITPSCHSCELMTSPLAVIHEIYRILWRSSQITSVTGTSQHERVSVAKHLNKDAELLYNMPYWMDGAIRCSEFVIYYYGVLDENYRSGANSHSKNTQKHVLPSEWIGAVKWCDTIVHLNSNSQLNAKKAA